MARYEVRITFYVDADSLEDCIKQLPEKGNYNILDIKEDKDGTSDNRSQLS